jgi:hypothetical protein
VRDVSQHFPENTYTLSAEASYAMLSMSRSRLGPAGDPPPNLGVASNAEPPIIVLSAPLVGSTSQIARPLSSASQIEWSCGT